MRNYKVPKEKYQTGWWMKPSDRIDINCKNPVVGLETTHHKFCWNSMQYMPNHPSAIEYWSPLILFIVFMTVVLFMFIRMDYYKEVG